MTSAEIPHPRPRAYLRPGALALVAAGGTIGTAIRHLLEVAFAPAPGGLPWVTFVINVTGAFALGALLTALARRGEDTGAGRVVRLGIGTGALGGYTTYSTFTVETWDLLGAGHTWAGLGYAWGSVLAGVAAAGLGLALARWLVPVRSHGEVP